MDLYQGKVKKMLFRKKNDEIDLEGKKNVIQNTNYESITFVSLSCLRSHNYVRQLVNLLVPLKTRK